MIKNNPAFILGCDANGYGIIRSIHKFNNLIPIIGIDHNPKSPGLFSRFLTKRFIISDPLKDERKFIEELLEIRKKFTQPPVLFITSDLHLEVISKFKEVLLSHFLFNIPDKELLNNILNKREQYKLFEKINVNIPKTYFLKSDEAADISQLNINFPVFIKGAKSFQWKEYFMEKGFIANNLNELDVIVKKTINFGLDIVIQELILGPNSNHYKISAYFDINGKIKLIFTTRKMRQFPVDFGVGCYMVSERVNELIKMGIEIFDKIRYKGVGSIEFKKDERDGKFKLIELNPRFWQQNYQASVSGLNFAEYYYLDCIGGKIEFQDNFKEKITYIDVINDFQSFRLNKSITDDNYLNWFRQVLTADGYAYFSFSDPMPIIKSSIYGIKLVKYIYKLIFG